MTHGDLGRRVKRGSMIWLIAAVGVGMSTVPAEAQVQGRHRARLARIEASLIPEGQPDARYSIPDRMEFYSVPGVSVAVMDAGVIAWARAWGVKKAGGGQPVTTETLFQAASISKPLTALAALELVERGVLDLDRDVNDYLVTWKLPENEFTAEAPVTLRGILSHTAGLTQHGFPGYALDSRYPSVPQILDGEGSANTGPVRVDMLPGTEWRYSGGGYTLLQQLLEDVSGVPFAELMRTTVLDPLGLGLSTYEQPLPPDRWEVAASAHGGGGGAIDSEWHAYPEMAAAGLWTTPFELLRMTLDIQEAAAGSVGRLLEPATVQEMLRPVMGGYGLGFGVDPPGTFGHGGSNAGFKAQLLATVEGGRAVVVMTNGDRGSSLAAEIIRAIRAEYAWPEPGGS